MFIINTVAMPAGPFDALFTLPELQGNLVSFIQIYQRLWWGRCRLDTWQQRYRELRHLTLSGLFAVDPRTQDHNTITSLGNKLDMCHRPTSESYRWPIMASMEPGLFWNNGENRLLAAGLRWPRAHEKFEVLLLAPDLDSASQVLQDPQEIISDQDLACRLDLGESRARVQMRLHFREGHPRLVLDSIGDTTPFRTQKFESADWVRRFCAWRDLYGTRPRLRVYCQDPDQARVESLYWDMAWAGPITQRANEYFNQQQDPGCHTLVILGSRCLCVDDLLLWMDPDYSVWHDPDETFFLMRPHFAWAPGVITVSDVMPR